MNQAGHEVLQSERMEIENVSKASARVALRWPCEMIHNLQMIRLMRTGNPTAGP